MPALTFRLESFDLAAIPCLVISRIPWDIFDAVGFSNMISTILPVDNIYLLMLLGTKNDLM